MQLDGGGNKTLEQRETPTQRRSKDSKGGASPSIAEHTFLEHANSSHFSNSVKCELLIAQRYSLPDTNLFTPIHNRQSVTNSSQVALSHPHIGFTPKLLTSINISSSPVDTYPTTEDFDDRSQPINPKSRNIYEIMEARHPFEALMADLGLEPIHEFEEDDGDILLEYIKLTPKEVRNGPESEMWKSAM